MSKDLGFTPEQLRSRVFQSPSIERRTFNYVRVICSPFDVQLLLGNGTVSVKEEQSITEELCVSLSPEFAKLLRDSLTEQLEGFEEKFGKIRDV